MSKVIESYFSLHSIVTAQYTNGNELITSNGKDYVGMYHILPNGEMWTEEKPEKRSVILSKKQHEWSPSVVTYNSINGITANNYISPQNVQPIITMDDYKIGYIYRFFVQRRNNPYTTIHEIDNEQYSSINVQNNIGINGNTWNYIMIKWYITGKSASAINRRTVFNHMGDFPGFGSYMTNYIEFVK